MVSNQLRSFLGYREVFVVSTVDFGFGSGSAIQGTRRIWSTYFLREKLLRRPPQPVCQRRNPLESRVRSLKIGVQHNMGEENLHIPLPELWGYTSGTAILTDANFEHLLFCI